MYAHMQAVALVRVDQLRSRRTRAGLGLDAQDTERMRTLVTASRSGGIAASRRESESLIYSSKSGVDVTIGVEI